MAWAEIDTEWLEQVQLTAVKSKSRSNARILRECLVVAVGMLTAALNYSVGAGIVGSFESDNVQGGGSPSNENWSYWARHLHF